MPQQVLNSTENNFTKGLITEFTGLNFPENAAITTDNTTYTIVGDVVRREGIDVEVNGSVNVIPIPGNAINTYKWNNVGGDGLTQIVVEQVGSKLYFYRSSSATLTSPLSASLLPSTIDVSTFVATGGTFNVTKECQFSDGNGYLFVYHPSCDPFYCTYTSGIITGSTINIRIRDFNGIPDNLAVTVRPDTLSAEHNYNLNNQGWTSGNAWIASSGDTLSGNLSSGTQPKVFTVASGLSITGGDTAYIYCTDPRASSFGVGSATVVGSGTVASYTGTTLSVTVTSAFGGTFSLSSFTGWTITQTNLGHITLWHTDIGNYPSNADVWWYFKDTTNIFNPTTTVANVTLSSSNAPRGHYTLNAFNQQRSLVSSIAGLTNITTPARPKTGTWFQGRVWYTGVDAQQAAMGDAPYYTWTENIYFSQIVLNNNTNFGDCFQVNDPTSDQLFNILPTDGGIITIQGSGSIYKLFPLQNALLVFAANGVWYLTGSQGIGFAADDYTIVKLSAVRSISSTSFVDVNGLPIFWNEEGIYQVESAKQGTSLLNSPLHVNPLDVTPLTIGTILSFYNEIPLSSKQYARGAYDPIEYVVQWTYKDTEATDVTDRYRFNKILNYNTANKAFFPHTVDNTNTAINGVVYVAGPGGLNTPVGGLKYPASNLTKSYWADEHDTTFTDWTTSNGLGINYISTFTTGYKLHGGASKRFQIPYIYIYSRLDGPVSYYIQSLWDYALNRNSGRWSVNQLTNINSPNFGMVFRRHRLRGWGLVLQIKITSVDGQPFDIIGWSLYETVNQGV